jgi:hypothetical protein
MPRRSRIRQCESAGSDHQTLPHTDARRGRDTIDGSTLYPGSRAISLITGAFALSAISSDEATMKSPRLSAELRIRSVQGAPTGAGRSPAERFVGTVRRDLLDHVVVLHEAHLRRLLREYIEYYNAERVHTSIADAPEGRASEAKPPGSARITRLPRVGGLHGRYAWREAA